MGGPISVSNSLIVTTFQEHLLHQLLIVLVLLAILVVAWNLLRSAQLRRAQAGAGESIVPAKRPASPEPIARRLLRVGFGLLWVFDGILQAQSAMPAGLATQVIAPTASSSPDWVQHVVNAGVTIWNNHPVTAAVAAVWVQVGIGLWLLVAPRGRWSQAGAFASVGWGLVVWCFGEAFGQIFAPGQTFLTGLPGGVLFYCLAGVLIALPEHLWSSRRAGRLLLGGLGLFLVGMSVLQAWPGRGFWQGVAHSKTPGNLVGMVQAMAATSQPDFLSQWVSGFASFDAAHGFAVNLFVVVALGAIGISFCIGDRRLLRPVVIAAAVFFLADWVLVQDLGFFGGLGTDPNSMIPLILCVLAGYLALTPRVTLTPEAVQPSQARGALARAKADPAYAFRSLAALMAGLVTLLGAAPMAVASVNPNADQIVTEATNGTPQATHSPAPSFSLTDQNGRPVSLASLRGKTLALTFLDPVCTTDCPIIGQEFRAADLALGVRASQTVFIAIVANPLYRTSFYMKTFDREQGLQNLPNWLFLTGNVAALSRVWDDYGVQVSVSPAGGMIDHSDIAYVIDANGEERYILSADPGASTSVTKSSFSGLLDHEITNVLTGSSS